MARVGEFCELAISRESDFGLYLDAGELGEVLLPGSLVPVGVMPYHKLKVFLYHDSEDRLTATTKIPYVWPGRFAYLEVVAVHPKMGAFLDWGLPKNLLLPFGQMDSQVRKGQGVVVTVVLDEITGRLFGTGKVRKFLNQNEPTYQPNDEVDLVILEETDLGYNAIVNHAHRGLLYHTDLAEALDYGDSIKGYIGKVRDDGKIDLLRDPAGFQRKDAMAEKIWDTLESAGGFLPYHDKSSAGSIREKFDMSKKAFKQGIGALYKSRRIVITDKGIEKSSSGK